MNFTPPPSSIPEFASAVFLSAVFVFTLGWLPGTSTMSGGFNLAEMVQPVTVLVIYGFGYVSRMTRASMVEVMTKPYVPTAVLKGLHRVNPSIGSGWHWMLISSLPRVARRLFC